MAVATYGNLGCKPEESPPEGQAAAHGLEAAVIALLEVSQVLLCLGIRSQHPPKPLQLQNLFRDRRWRINWTMNATMPCAGVPWWHFALMPEPAWLMAAALGRMTVYEREDKEFQNVGAEVLPGRDWFGLPHLPAARHSSNEGRLSLSQPLHPVQDKGFCRQ